MPTAVKKTTPKTNKRGLEQEVIQKIEMALDGYKELLGEKKFKSRIKKAGKLIMKGKSIVQPAKKVVPPAKKKVAAKAAKKLIVAKA